MQKDNMTQNDNPRSSYEGTKVERSENGIDSIGTAPATTPLVRYYLRSTFCELKIVNYLASIEIRV